MRAMLLFRGAPGSGKSTIIEELGLTNYTLSADNIRLLMQSPAMTVDGSYTIAADDEKTVWNFLLDALEARMQRGEFVVIDATNSKTSDMQKYKHLSDTYRYRMYLIDLTDLPIEECKRRNANRLPEYKRVPESVIDNQYARFKTQGIPSGIKVLDKTQPIIPQMSFRTIDFSNYKRIHHIGDIHGCYTVLKKYLDMEYRDEDLFIFTGDYIDRGIESAEVLNYMFKLSENKKNFIFLEGNHEKNLRAWANDMVSEYTREFKESTLHQLDNGQVSKKEARKFCRNLRQFAYYTYHDKVVVATHGGVPKMLDNTLFMPTKDFIRGVGKYEDVLTVNLAFETNMPNNYYQIHGHRNIQDLPIHATDRCFNLEGQVELGGHLRIVVLDENGFTPVYIQNDVFAIDSSTIDIDKTTITEEMMFNIMQDNNLVAERKSKKYPISAFNFKPQVFRGRLWDSQTIKARGLFFNNETKKIVLRSYDKFFNINEREATKLMNLKKNFEFPVYEYVKYNGFLGLQGALDGELIYASKSSLESDHAKWFKDIFESSITHSDKELIYNYIEDNNCTFVYEVIDPINDPHIIKYDKSFVVLIAIVYNEVEFRQMPYEELLKVGAKLGLQVKERSAVINNWKEFFERYEETNKEDFTYNGENIEGFVYEGSNGFQTKSKLSYYNTWKMLRGVSSTQIRHNHIRFTGALTTPESNLYYGWLRQQSKEKVKDKSIIELRDMFYEEII